MNPTSSIQWTPEAARQWASNHPRLLGLNYIPASAISYTEMWMDYAFDAAGIDRELALTADIGFNSVRVVLPFVVWEADPAGFRSRWETFLCLCAGRGLGVVPAFFDDCAFGTIVDPVAGRQPEVDEGWYANGWTPSPGHALVRDTTQHPRLERYVRDLASRHRDDPRVLFWDLYNEPGNSGLNTDSLPLLKAVFAWMREVAPSQPLTAGVWSERAELASLSAFQLDQSDILTFHDYNAPEALEKNIIRLAQLGRPLICTEWLNRNVTGAQTVAGALEVFARHGVGAMHWGLVNGRTQTHLHWGSRPGDARKEFWQHDLFHSDFTPYNPEEIACFRREAARVRQGH